MVCSYLPGEGVISLPIGVASEGNGEEVTGGTRLGFKRGFIKGLNCCEPEMAPAPLPAGALLPAASPPASASIRERHAPGKDLSNREVCLIEQRDSNRDETF